MRALSHWMLVGFMALNLVCGHHWVHVPSLLHHYQEHLAEGEDDLAFIDFLVLHYADAEHSDSDGSHEDLPFKHDHNDHIGVDHVFWTPVLKAHHLFLPIEMATALYDPDGLLDGYRRACLQPPKFA